MDRVVELIAIALRPCSERPLVLFGHSMGGLVAYEVARRLHAAGAPPTHLVVSATPIPGRHRPTGSVDDRGDDELLDEIHAMGGTDPTVVRHPELRDLVLTVVRNDFRLVETYEPGTLRPLPCPVTAIIGDDDPRVDAAEAAHWQASTTDFTLLTFPGNHFYLATQVREVVAGLLSRVFDTPHLFAGR